MSTKSEQIDKEKTLITMTEQHEIEIDPITVSLTKARIFTANAIEELLSAHLYDSSSINPHYFKETLLSCLSTIEQLDVFICGRNAKITKEESQNYQIHFSTAIGKLTCFLDLKNQKFKVQSITKMTDDIGERTEVKPIAEGEIIKDTSLANNQ